MGSSGLPLDFFDRLVHAGLEFLRAVAPEVLGNVMEDLEVVLPFFLEERILVRRQDDGHRISLLIFDFTFLVGGTDRLDELPEPAVGFFEVDHL